MVTKFILPSFLPLGTTAHIYVIGTSSIAREEYTMHALHLNSRGKKRLTQLLAVRFVGGHASGIISIDSQQYSFKI
jgi:hypothetical protein